MSNRNAERIKEWRADASDKLTSVDLALLSTALDQTAELYEMIRIEMRGRRVQVGPRPYQDGLGPSQSLTETILG